MKHEGIFYLQKGADLFGEVQQTLLSLVQCPSDGHSEPLPYGLRVALVEEVSGSTGLGMDAVLQGLGQENGAGADGSIWNNKENSSSLEMAPSVYAAWETKGVKHLEDSQPLFRSEKLLP